MSFHKKKFSYLKTEIVENKNEECNFSRASIEIMLDRICVNGKQEFPFTNFFGN